MSYHELETALRDVAFTTAVPFEEGGGAVRHEAYRDNLRAIEDDGARLFLPCGNTGEYYSLTHRERIGVVQSTTEAVSADSTVVAGAAGSAGTVAELADAYASAGVDGLMVMHPDHTYVHEAGVRQYYREIAANTDLGIVLYKRGPELSDEAIADLATVENVVAVKYAVNDVEAFSSLAERVPDDFVCINGIAERFAPAFALEGADGFTTGIGNFAPRATLALHDAIENEEWERARRIRNLVRPFEDLREESGPDGTFGGANNVPAVKYGMELAGLTGGAVRAPLVDLSQEDKVRAEEYYQRIVEDEVI